MNVQKYEGDWQHFHPTEFLLPTLEKEIELREFPFLEERRYQPHWTAEDIRSEILRLGHWEYYFPFDHELSTRIYASFDDRSVDFHRYRSRLISETVMDLLGEDAAQTTVLDLACHCGIFSMDLAYRGIRQVHGIDVREKNIRQAEFLRDYYGIGNASFECRDLYDLLVAPQSYDVVLCLGILYHVTQPIELLEFCYQTGRRFTVIETICHKQPFSGYILATGKNPEVAIEGTRSTELHPTYRGLIDTLREVGYRDILEVVGHCAREIDLFSSRYRRCLIAFK